MVDVEEEKQKYVNLRDKLKSTRNNVLNAIEKLDDVDHKVVNGYSINDSSGDDNYLINVKKELKNIYNDIVNNALPAVNDKIKELTIALDIDE